MLRRWATAVLMMGLALGSGGCIALVAGAGGTVGWQAGKAVSEEQVPMDRAVRAALSVLEANKVKLTEKVVKSKATQMRGERPDGANVAVDVISTGDEGVRIEVRVGLADKSGSRDLLHQIKKRL